MVTCPLYQSQTMPACTLLTQPGRFSRDRARRRAPRARTRVHSTSTPAVPLPYYAISQSSVFVLANVEPARVDGTTLQVGLQASYFASALRTPSAYATGYCSIDFIYCTTSTCTAGTIVGIAQALSGLFIHHTMNSRYAVRTILYTVAVVVDWYSGSRAVASCHYIRIL